MMVSKRGALFAGTDNLCRRDMMLATAGDRRYHGQNLEYRSRVRYLGRWPW